LDSTIESKIALIETKRDNISEQLAVYNDEKSSINQAVASLRDGLSNNVIQYKDPETGEIITTTSSSTRRALEKQLDQAIERQTEINTRVDNLNQQLFDYETEIVEIRSASEIGSELGPLKYLSGLTGLPMDKIINYLLLTIIFVFDPLAIALVVAANFAFEQLKPKGETKQFLKNILPPEPEVDVSNSSDKELDKELTEEIEEKIGYEVYGDNKEKSLQHKIDKLKLIQSSTTLSSKRWNRIQEEIERTQQTLDSLPKSDSSDQINYF